MKFDPDQMTQLIRHRRSVYPVQYSGEMVPRPIIEEMLENANWAPTHKLTEPWRFMVFSGDGLKKLAGFMADLYKKVTTADGTFQEKKHEKLLSKPLLASHVISIGMKRDEQERIPEMEEVASVACAVQNMYLTAAAHGVGCYWGTGGITYFEEAKPFFGLGPNDKLMGFFYVGMTNSRWPQGRRKPIEDKVAWVSG